MRIEVVPYQSVWPELFRDIEAKLQDESCGVSVIAIEHVGSTSIPGLPAKPTLNIDVLVAGENFAAGTAALQPVGYDYTVNSILAHYQTE